MEDFENEGLVVTKQPTFVRLLLAIYHAVMSHSDMVCYFAVFMLQIRNPTIASLPLSLMVFFWGTLSIPRPTKRFWVTMIAYTEVTYIFFDIFISHTLNEIQRRIFTGRSSCEKYVSVRIPQHTFNSR